MKLVTINVEGDRHFTTVKPFIAQSNPDIICLQECPKVLANYLREQEYFVTFEPQNLRERSSLVYEEGILLASREPHAAEVMCYYREYEHPVVFDKAAFRETTIKIAIFAEIAGVCVATTHFTWTPNGSVPNDYQKQDIKTLMAYLDNKPPHIICGDFNIPRGHNELYDTYLTPRYKDMVPVSYHSSLDPKLHKYSNTDKVQHIFTDYMVDYIFARPPISVQDVSLTFGISDHAAVTGTIVIE